MLERFKIITRFKQTLKRDWVQFCMFVIKRFLQDRGPEQAGSLTYTTLFAVVPMLTVFLVIISSINALKPALSQVQDFIFNNALPQTNIAYQKAIETFTQNSSNLTVIGIIVLFVTTILMLFNIETAFNRIWRVRSNRNGIGGFMRYWTIISLGPILLGSAFAISSAMASMNFLNSSFVGYELDSSILLQMISFILSWLGFTLLYWAIPNRSVPLKSALLAALFTTVVFDIIRFLFGFIMSNFTSYQLIYGAFAAIPIFLLWIYTLWNVILIGVQISYALTAFHAEESKAKHPLLTMMDILQLFYVKQKLGETVHDKEALSLIGRREVGNWPSYVNLLKEQSIIIQTSVNEYALLRNLDEINFWQFYQRLPYTLPSIEDLEQNYSDETWLKVIGSPLRDADEYLEKKLSISLATILDPEREELDK